MGTQTFNRGGTDATNDWSGAGPALGDDMIVSDRFGPVINNLDHSTISLGSLQFLPGAIGRFGGGSDGAFLVKVDNTTSSKLLMHGTRAECTIDAGSTLNKIENTDIISGNKLHIVGGWAEDVTMAGGLLTVASAVKTSNFYSIGGESDHAYISTNGLVFTAIRGTHNIRRGYGSVNVGPEATVIIDLDPAVVMTGLVLNIWGGTVIYMNGNFPSIYGNGGTLDLRGARSSQILGATAFKLLGTKVIENPTVIDTSNVSFYGAMNRPIGSPLAV